MILNYTNRKDKDWFDHVNSAIVWKKPILVIINRAFLVSNTKYKKIVTPLNLIIHDECHTIVNETTQNFYSYILDKYPETKCLGFSATPNINIKPYNNIISDYTIYNACNDNVIVKPKIKWIKTSEKMESLDTINLIKHMTDSLYYKKIIVWCGMINKCRETAILWKEHFTNFSIFIDTSEDDDANIIEKYNDIDSHAILFCACKHREGSDINNLDCCIFLDGVEDRNPKTFVQCIGRVLRKDKLNNKKQASL